MIPAGWGCWIFWPHWGECQDQPHGWSAAPAAFSSSRRAPLCVGCKTASGLSRMISGGDLVAGLTAAVWLCLSQVPAASSPTACSRWGPVRPGQGRWAPGKGAWSCGTARPAQPSPAWPRQGEPGWPCYLFPGWKKKRPFSGFVCFKTWTSQRQI